MTLNVRHNFFRFFLFINECTNYFKNTFLDTKKLFYQKGFGTECAPYMNTHDVRNTIHKLTLITF